ncbi:MAG: transporter substrate-binding domain-containing protein [Opitutaceae bacterium]|nr:transporter substrate-binding domain-containing protein [Opitutaceae bacterium]
MFKVLYPSLLVLLLLSQALWAGPIRVGVEINSPPLSFVDAQGQPTGFSAELLNAMEATGEIDLEIVPDYWTQHLRAFASGEIDVLANVTITEERRATMDFSISHAYVHGVIYYRKGTPRLTRTDQFAGKTIGTLIGSIAYTNAMTHGGWGATIIPYPSWQAALDATRKGETDAALFIRKPASWDEVNPGDLKWSFLDDVIHKYHFAVRQDDARTLEQLNAALATIRHNGTFDRIYAKWIGPLEPHPIRFADLRPYYLPGTLVLAGLLGLFYWQRRMVRRLARQTAALKESEERWKFALEGSGDGVWDWDARTGRVLRSKRWKEMLGYAEDEIGTGMNEWLDHVHPDDLPASKALHEAHERGETPSFAIEHRMRCKDGTWKWILNRGMVVQRDASGRPLRVIGTHTDLTARKQAENDRLILGKLESTGVLAGGIAHDFNNLLTAILLNLDMARFAHGDAAQMLPRIEAAGKAALAARSLTQQLITFAKGDSSVVRITDIGHLLKSSMPLVLSGSAVRGEVRVAPDLWTAEVDAGQLGQVVRNLVLNAREAMPRGGVVSVQADNVTLAAGAVGDLPAGNYLHIRVSDQGEGIAPENLQKIFDPYFSTKQRGAQKGMGLGLTICHSVVKRHRGALTVESTLGRGTTFHLHLPAAIEPPSARVDSNPPLPGAATVSRRILIMDDEAIMRDSLHGILGHLGHAVETTADGPEAIAAYTRATQEGRPFDVVILDLTIPGGMGGRETFEALRAVDPYVRAVVMSGYTDDRVMRDYRSLGFKAALPKPFAGHALEDILNQACSD